MKSRGFSLYDIEQFLREAGAKKVNEKAVVSLEKELEDTVGELLAEASLYANYAGRKRLIKRSDIVLLHRNGQAAHSAAYPVQVRRRALRRGPDRLSPAHAVEMLALVQASTPPTAAKEV